MKHFSIVKKVIFLVCAGLLSITIMLSVPPLLRTLMFYPDAPKVDFPAPSSMSEARLQDLEYFEKYVRGYDRSFHFRARAKALNQINELKKNVDQLTPARFELAISEIVALGENGHSNVWNHSRAKRYPAMPYQGYWFDDGYHIVATTSEYKSMLGARVTHIGNTDIELIKDAFRKYYGGEDSGFFAYALPFLLQNTAFLFELGFIDNKLNLDVTIINHDGGVEKSQIKVMPPHKDRYIQSSWRWLVPEWDHDHNKQFIGFSNDRNYAPLYVRTNDEFQFSRLVEAKALYVQYRQNHDGALSISEFNKRVKAEILLFQPQVLILDQRFNGGGDYLKTADLMFEIPELMPEDSRVYAITGHETFSAGISSLGFLKQALENELTIVGRRIGDSPLSWGETNAFVLPNSGVGMTAARGLHDQLYGCEDWIQCYWTDFKYPTAVSSLEPDVLVPFTFKDYAAGVDAAIAAILSIESRHQQ